MKSRFLICFALLLCFQFSFAQSFYVQITPEAGFDAVDAIHSEFNSQQPQSILTILNEFEPAEIKYVITNRPYGQRLELMIASPNWSAAQLARSLWITFEYPVDVTAVMENLSSHEAVEVVYFDFTLNPLKIQPGQPRTGDDIIVNLSYLPFGCDFPTPTTLSGEDFDVTVNDSVIELDVSAYRNFLPSTTICPISPTPLSAYDLGTLPAGDYTVIVNHVYNEEAFPVTQQQRNVVGQFLLSVGGSTATAVPVLSLWSLLSLAIIFMIFGFRYRMNLD